MHFITFLAMQKTSFVITFRFDPFTFPIYLSQTLDVRWKLKSSCISLIFKAEICLIGKKKLVKFR